MLPSCTLLRKNARKIVRLYVVEYQGLRGTGAKIRNSLETNDLRNPLVFCKKVIETRLQQGRLFACIETQFQQTGYFDKTVSVLSQKFC